MTSEFDLFIAQNQKLFFSDVAFDYMRSFDNRYTVGNRQIQF